MTELCACIKIKYFFVVFKCSVCRTTTDVSQLAPSQKYSKDSTEKNALWVTFKFRKYCYVPTSHNVTRFHRQAICLSPLNMQNIALHSHKIQNSV